MPNALFDSGRDAFARGSIGGATRGWLGATAKILLAASYPININSDVFKSAVPTNAIIAVSTYLASKSTLGNGVCDALDIVIPGVSHAATVLYLIGFQDTGASDTSLLIWAHDTASAGLPGIYNLGQDLTIAFDNGSSRIFKL